MAYSIEDAAKSQNAFGQWVIPAVAKHFAASFVISVEDQYSAFERWLDLRSTIDGLVLSATGLQTIGSKVQFGKNYAAFSIRRSRPSGTKTEYQKLKTWLDGDESMYGADFLIHAFVADDGRTADVAISPTPAVMAKVTEDKVRSTKDGETFYYVPWREVEGVRVYRVFADGQLALDVTAEYLRRSTP